MAFIKSRKHALPARKSLSTACMVSTATLLTGLAFASAVSATDGPATSTAATNDGPQVRNAKNMPGVKVDATAVTDYRVDKLSSPKFTQPLVDTTQTISIISKDLIQQQGATTLTEALRNSPGVGTFYVGENGTTNTGDSVYMRGFDTSSSIFVDGVRDLGSISRDVFNVEQIEVTKGPDGNEYGRTAPTGAINMVSKQAQLTNAISGSLSYGGGDHKRATADWTQQMSGTSAFRLNVVGQNSGVTGRDNVENDRWGVAPTVAFGLGTATRVYLDYLHVKQNNVPDGGVPTIGLPGYSNPDVVSTNPNPPRSQLNDPRMVNPSNFYGTDADHDHVQTDMFTANIEHDINADTTLHNTLRWGRTHEDYLLTSFMGTYTNLLTPNPLDPSTWTIARSNPTFKNQTNRILTDQANITVNFETGSVTHNLSAGIELTQEKVGTLGEATIPIGKTWPAANLYDPNPNVSGPSYGFNNANSEGKTNTEAAYLFDTMKFGTQWQVNAGVRFDHYNTDFNSTVVCSATRAPLCGALPVGTIIPGVNASPSGNLPNYKLGILYKPAANGSIYANFAVSQEPPGGTTLMLSSTASSADQPNLDPQKARTAEVGTKWDVLNEKLLLTGALYSTTVTNDPVQDPTNPTVYYQIGKKRVQGIELNAVGRITDNWAVSTGFTTMNASVVDGPAVAKDGTSDLAYTPKTAFTAWTTYHLPFDLTIGGGARYSGEMKRGTDSAVGTPAFTEAYWVFDAMASYPVNKNFDLQLNFYNLFDKDYVAAINKSGYRYTPGTPRSAMLTANFRF